MTQRFVLVLVAVVAYLAGMLTSYAMMKPRTPAGVIHTTHRVQGNTPRNGFTGMEFRSAAHSPMIVRHVVTGSPADQVGIKAGDHVIGLGTVMNPTMSHAIKIIEASRPGEILTVTVQRGEDAFSKEVRLMTFAEYVRLQELERTRMLGTKRE